MIQQTPRIFVRQPSHFYIDDFVESTTAENALLSCLPSEQRYKIPYVGQAAMLYLIFFSTRYKLFVKLNAAEQLWSPFKT